MKKRLTALLLTFCMLFTMAPAVYAAHDNWWPGGGGNEGTQQPKTGTVTFEIVNGTWKGFKSADGVDVNDNTITFTTVWYESGGKEGYVYECSNTGNSNANGAYLEKFLLAILGTNGANYIAPNEGFMVDSMDWKHGENSTGLVNNHGTANEEMQWLNTMENGYLNIHQCDNSSSIQDWFSEKATYVLTLCPYYTVNFDVDGVQPAPTDLTDPASITNIKANSKITEPTQPDAGDDWEFLGWYTAEGEEWDFSTDVVTSDITLYAKWSQNTYTVTFKDYDDTVISTKADYRYGDSVNVPTDPTRVGYVFTGWMPDVVEKVAGNAIYTATYEVDQWNDAENKLTGGDGIPDKYQALVTYKVAGGTWDGNEDVADRYAVFTMKTKGDDGVWNAVDPVPELGITIPNVSNAAPDADHTTPAYWSPVPYDTDKAVNGAIYTYTFTTKGDELTFTFDANGGAWENAVNGYTMGAENKTAAKSAYHFGDAVDKIAVEPTREGYTFVGWYTTKALTAPLWTQYTPLVSVYEDTTVFAKWEAVPAQPEEPAAKTGTLIVYLQDENGTELGYTEKAVTADYKLAFVAGDDVDYVIPASVEAYKNNYIYEKVVSGELTGEITSDRQYIIVCLQYTEDEWDDEEDKLTGGDGIPDKYQALVTYKVAGGTWDGNEDVADRYAVFTMKTKGDDGVWNAVDPVPELGITIPNVSNAAPDADHTTPAYWSPVPYDTDKAVNGAIYTYTFTTKGDELTFTFDANGGAWTSAVEGYTMGDENKTAAKSGYLFGDKADKIAVEPTREGYTFAGWHTKNGSGELTGRLWYEYAEGQFVPVNIYEDTTVYAKWDKNLEEPEAPAAKQGTLIVYLQDENGTQLGYEQKSVTADYKLAFEAGDDVDYVIPASVEAYENNYTYEKVASGELTGEITSNGQYIVVCLQYTKDMIGEGKDEETEEPDGIPDKYQVTVLYKSEKGGEIVDIEKEVLTLTDKVGNYVTRADVEASGSEVERDSSKYRFRGWYADSDKCVLENEDDYELDKFWIEEAVGGEIYVITAEFSRKSSGSSSGKKPALNTEEHFQYIMGYPDGTVGPLDRITRAEVASIFYRLLDDDTREYYFTTENAFPDMNESMWYNKAVSTLANAGIITGCSDGLFHGGRTITRAELATIIAKFDEDIYVGHDFFTDIAGHWARPYINVAAENGWIVGDGNALFRPYDAITRAEVMTMINAVLEREVDADGLCKGYKKWSDNIEGKWYYYQVIEATNYHEYVVEKNDSEKWIKILDDKTWDEAGIK